MIGYAASVLIIISLLMKSVLRLRLFGLAGGVIFLVYGLMLQSVPVAGLNLINICINLYFIRQMLTAKTYFKILEVDRRSRYVTSFFEFHQRGIARDLPGF